MASTQSTQGNDLTKLIAGSCGTQIGMLFTCGTFAGVLMVCAVCAFSGVLSVTLNDFAREVSSLSEPAAGLNNGVELAAMNDPKSGSPAVTESEGSAPQAAPILPTATPVGPPPMVTAHDGRVNLRIGPSTSYPRIGLLPHNASLEIVGRNQEGTWWLVSTTDGLAWVFNGVVATTNLHNNIPIVDITLPPLSKISDPSARATAAATQAIVVPQPTPTPTISPGTPTPQANLDRVFVQQTVGYKQLRQHLSAPPMSENFSPQGHVIAITEGVKLHLVAGDGSYTRVLLESNEAFKIRGDIVWSPNGEYLAFVVENKNTGCRPCKSVGLIRLDDESLIFLKTPNNLDGEAPRWTQEGRLLVNVHPAEPAAGTTYIFDVTGRGVPANGLYRLSTSHEGQRWHPWQPGRSWQAAISERPDTYYD